MDAALREARDANIITAEPSTDRYEFRHALLHEAVYADVLPGERRTYHTRYAELLAATPARSGIEAWAELAHHWRAAGDQAGRSPPWSRPAWPPRPATPCPRPTATTRPRWSSGSRRTATESDGTTTVALDRDELLARAADAASRAGALERAIGLTSTAIDEVDPTADPTAAGLLHERRAWFLWRAGRHEEGLEEYREAVGLVPDEPASAARARVLAAYADALERIERAGRGQTACRGRDRHRRGRGFAVGRGARPSRPRTRPVRGGGDRRRPHRAAPRPRAGGAQRGRGRRGRDLRPPVARALRARPRRRDGHEGGRRRGLLPGRGPRRRRAAPGLHGRRLPPPARPLARGGVATPGGRARPVGSTGRRPPRGDGVARRRSRPSGERPRAPRDGALPGCPDPRRPHQRAPLPGAGRARALGGPARRCPGRCHDGMGLTGR